MTSKKEDEDWKNRNVIKSYCLIPIAVNNCNRHTRTRLAAMFKNREWKIYSNK